MYNNNNNNKSTNVQAFTLKMQRLAKQLELFQFTQIKQYKETKKEKLEVVQKKLVQITCGTF